jgi:AMP phosphorylase
MKLKVRYVDLDVAEASVLIHDDDCTELGVMENDRVRLDGKKTVTALVTTSDTILERGEILVPQVLQEQLDVQNGAEINVAFSVKPSSVRSIRKKMDGDKLTKEEIHDVVFDILDSKLSKIEISAWLTALYINGMDDEEIANFTQSIVDTGDKIEFDRSPVFDFHSIGGVPGNKVTPIVVSIVAAAGLMLPKTSSRAISSACGTSDFVETFCNVELDAARLKEIAEDVGGVLAWGGAMNLAPVDDMVIKVEYPLGINPRAQMMASILSKKMAIGATHLLLDIPTGAGTKVKTIEQAREYARSFMSIGDRLGIHIEAAITYADQPVGNTIGPKLEARECIRVLEGNPHPASVVEKACDLAGIILEMGGIPNGSEVAREILSSGKAMEKFREIVAAQGGNHDIKSTDLEPGKYMAEVFSIKSGYVHSVKNAELVTIARAAGAPADKGAGIELLHKKGQRVEKGELLFRIYADNESKLKRAKDIAVKVQPMSIEGMLIKRVVNTPVQN